MIGLSYMYEFLKVDTYEVGLQSKREIRKREIKEISSHIKLGTQNENRNKFTVQGFDIKVSRKISGIDFFHNNETSGLFAWFKLRLKKVERYSLLVTSINSSESYITNLTTCEGKITSLDNIYHVGTWDDTRSIEK